MHGRPARPTPHHSSPSCRVLSFCFLSLLRFAPWLSSLHLLSNPFLFESPLTHANLDLAVDSIVDCLVECFAPSHLTPHTALASQLCMLQVFSPSPRYAATSLCSASLLFAVCLRHNVSCALSLSHSTRSAFSPLLCTNILSRGRLAGRWPTRRCVRIFLLG